MMQLESLLIRRETYGPHSGKLTGRVKFHVKDKADIELVLDEAVSRKIVSVCADEIVRASHDIATKMTAEIITQTAIAAPEDPDESDVIGEPGSEFALED